MSQQQIVEKFQFMQQELKELQAKSIQLEIDLSNHTHVAETLEKLPEDRKCYRLIGDVLVQSNVSATLPDLQQQIASFKEILLTYKQKISEKEKEIIDYQKEYNIQFRPLSELKQNE